MYLADIQVIKGRTKIFLLALCIVFMYIYQILCTFTSSPRKLPKLSTSISVAVFVKQLVEGGRDTLDLLTEKLNYVYV